MSGTLVEQPRSAPTRKVAAGALAAAFTTVLAWFVEQVFGVDIPAGVEGALTTVFSFVTAYLVRDFDNTPA